MDNINIIVDDAIDHVVEVRLPSARGNMMVRVVAPSIERAVEGAVYWFTRDPEGELDIIDGNVTVSDVTADPSRVPMWRVTDDYPPTTPEFDCA